MVQHSLSGIVLERLHFKYNIKISSNHYPPDGATCFSSRWLCSLFMSTEVSHYIMYIKLNLKQLLYFKTVQWNCIFLKDFTRLFGNILAIVTHGYFGKYWRAMKKFYPWEQSATFVIWWRKVNFAIGRWKMCVWETTCLERPFLLGRRWSLKTGSNVQASHAT